MTSKKHQEKQWVVYLRNKPRVIVKGATFTAALSASGLSLSDFHCYREISVEKRAKCKPKNVRT